MNLYSEIINIPVRHNRTIFQDQVCYLMYKEGHRDARHKAAELSLKAETRIEELEFLLKEALPWLGRYEDCHGTPEEITLLLQKIKGKLK